ncbi:MAG: HPr kinase/phosphatase C-terminal domain-containing protein [Magnetospirillum sp.]|nr:HPr kinase/phosphatase C-terminal domain-containing protein [Magnetospirillum sp.]
MGTFHPAGMLLVHGTTVDIQGNGVLVRGPSGSGKSDLALRLIDSGATLVADDQTELFREGGSLSARAPATLAGLIEVRGVGIVRLPHRASAPVALVVDLVPADAVERLPMPANVRCLGVDVPLLRIAAFEVSTVAKVRLAALSSTRDIIRP